MGDNKKFRPPKVMVSPCMLKAGMDFMAAAMDADQEDLSDEALVIGLFMAM